MYSKVCAKTYGSTEGSLGLFRVAIPRFIDVHIYSGARNFDDNDYLKFSNFERSPQPISKSNHSAILHHCLNTSIKS